MKRRMLTKVLSMFLALTLVLGTVPADASFAAETTVMSEENGGGTPREAAVSVTTVDELMAVADGNYVLEENLELPADWKPIAELSGTFDGNGHTVTLSGERLFVQIAAGGTVKNLSLDGTTADNVDVSTLVKTNNGTVRNCVSYVAVSATESMGKASGFVHVNNGTISNCLFNGTLTTKSDKPRYRYGIAGNNGGTISSSYYVDADDRYQGVCGGTVPSYEAKVTAEAIVTEEFLAKMNDGLAEGDLAWGLADGKPVPGGADSGSENDVDKSALAAAIADAEGFDLTTELYSDASLQDFKNAIAAANVVNNDAGAVQDQIDEACAALTEAQDGLTVLSLEPVDLTDKKVTEIDSPLALASMEKDGLYRLTADIDLSQTGAWWSVDAEMPAGAVLDGNGHTITLDGSFSGLFKKIGTDAVVQNLGIKGSMMSWGSSSAIANGCYGRIINCWSLAQVTTTSDANVGGLVATLYSGGGISNCYSAGLVNGTPEGNKGGIAGEIRENTVVQNSYWLDKAAADAVGSAEGRVLGCAPKNRKEFYSDEFTALLNANKGTNGLAWGVCAATGYPWFGEAGTYIPPEEVKHTVTFTAHDGAVQDFYNTDGLTISRLNTTGWAGFAGTFSVKDSETPVYFAVPDYKNDGKDAIYIGADNDVYAENTGTATVVAYSSYSFGNYSGKLFQFEVTVTDNTDIAGVRFVYGNKTIENNQTLTVAGSEVVKLTPQVQLTGSTEWKTVPNAYFTFTGSEGNYCENTGKCWAKVPGESTITAVGMNQKITISLVSVYVPITAIKPIPEGTYKLHERNPNSSGNFVDLKLAADQFDSVVATPYNASYAHDWTLTSDHPDVAEYYEEWIAAVLPKKPGTAVLTAKANDPEHPVSGQTTITLEYFNPVTAVTMTENHITVKENEKLHLPMTLTGPKSAEGYHVSEAGMTWKYESTDGGSVKISRDTDVVELQQTKEYCISNDSYFIKGITAGTVKVTGTPADTTGNAQPVTFTVTVEGNGTVTPPERPDKTEKIQTILDTVSTQFKGTGLDWNVVDMSAYGMADQMDLAVLKEGAEAVLDKTGAPSTDFERVAIALTAAGIDASNFERADGTKENFIKKIYTMEKLGTVNGYIFALNAYDSGNYPLPKDALWTREKVIDYLLSVQTNDGGWNLSGKTTAAADVDMTAMAVTALSLYQDRADVAEATAKALEYLSDAQTDNGGFKSGGQENSNSAAMVILALTSLNIDPDKDARFVKGNCSVVDGLLGFETAEHTFGFTNNEKSNAMATEQGFRALTAYKNWQKEKDAYYIYDFSANVTPEGPTEPDEPTVPEEPTVDKTALSKAIKEAEGLKQSDYTAESFQAVADALKEAKAVAAKADATQEEVDAAAAKLAEAVKALKKPEPKPPVTDEDKDKDKEITLNYKNYPISVTGKNLDEYELVLKALTANDADVKRMQQVTPSDCSLIRLYDVKLLKNGEEVQPENAVKVNFNMGSKYNGKTLTVLHIVDGKAEKLKGKVEDGILTVSVDTLGKFGVTVTTASIGNNTADDTDTSAAGNGSGSSGNGSSSSGNGSVQTGDETPLMFYTLLFCAAAFLWILGKPIIGKLEGGKEK